MLRGNCPEKFSVGSELSEGFFLGGISKGEIPHGTIFHAGNFPMWGMGFLV